MRYRLLTLLLFVLAFPKLGYAQAPFTPEPQAFPGAQQLVDLVDYLFYAAWIVVALMLAYSAIVVHRGGHMNEGFKRSLEGVIIAAFLLTFGWAILTGAI